MESSDERREVAARLREAADSDEWLDVTINNAILYAIGEVRRPIADTLADLIDPTCAIEYGGYLPESVKGMLGVYFCSECGSPIYNDVEPAYCPYCGARVVGGDE